MSTERGDENSGASGYPELTELGTQIELLRVGRGLSKQYLARRAGTSRQQLWRVMTGKSELTSSLRQRLAEALQVDGSLLSRTDRLMRSSRAHSAFERAIGARISDAVAVLPDQTRVTPHRPRVPPDQSRVTPDQSRVSPDQTRVTTDQALVTTAPGERAEAARVERYLGDCAAIERTLATLPVGPAGRRIKRSLLNALEEVATEHGVRLCREFFELRGRVVNDDV